MTPKSNKQRGAVKLEKVMNSRSAGTANMHRADPNQAQGPRSGNAGNRTKQAAFLAEKNNRTSYFQELADMVMNKLTVRGTAHKTEISPALEPISATTRVKRGPTRGNQ